MLVQKIQLSALAFVCFGLPLSTLPGTAACAESTYTYVGNTFLYIGGNGGVSHVSGSFTVPLILAPNTTYNLASTLTGYSFSDGRTEWNPGNYPGGPVPPFNTANEFLVTTGIDRNIVSWQISVISDAPNAIVATHSLDYATGGKVLDETNVYSDYVAYSFAPGNINGQQGIPGTWTVTSVPEPESFGLLLAGLAALRIAIRHRKKVYAIASDAA